MSCYRFVMVVMTTVLAYGKEVIIDASADAYLRSDGDRNTCDGADLVLTSTVYWNQQGTLSRADTRVLVFFTLDGVLPSAAFKIDLAQIEMTGSFTEGSNAIEFVGVHRLTKPWHEIGRCQVGAHGGATWEYSQYPVVSWDQPGGDFVTNATDKHPLSTKRVGAVLDQWDVTADVRDLVDGSVPNYGWIFTAPSLVDTEEVRFEYVSKEKATVLAPGPVLRITYTETVLHSGTSTISPSTKPYELTVPSQLPSLLPTNTRSLSNNPSHPPSLSSVPSRMPSIAPTKTQVPSSGPSAVPTVSSAPSRVPSNVPTKTQVPSFNPSDQPSFSSVPSQIPSNVPTKTHVPSSGPSGSPSLSSAPSRMPSIRPTNTQIPSRFPSVMPSSSPSVFLSDTPSWEPSRMPFSYPSPAPSHVLSVWPTSSPSVEPSTILDSSGDGNNNENTDVNLNPIQDELASSAFTSKQHSLVLAVFLMMVWLVV